MTLTFENNEISEHNVIVGAYDLCQRHFDNTVAEGSKTTHKERAETRRRDISSASSNIAKPNDCVHEAGG